MQKKKKGKERKEEAMLDFFVCCVMEDNTVGREGGEGSHFRDE